ncbi:MAG: CotH kinase family protein, partial [Actinobacteria bacterium]|nr:CotH kinase family protein [Actinomycetota bacterium]
LVVAEDRDLLVVSNPGLQAVGNFEGRLSHRTDRIQLLDANGNPADEVRYYDGGRWPGYADGYGPSLELRDPHADNSQGEMWAASDESQDSEWVTYTYRGRPTQAVGPSMWNEFVFGLLDEGEVLLDDISVIDNPGDEGIELIQDGAFDEEDAATWRFLGTHANARVITDPGDPGNKVLHLIATGATEHMHNHVETTYADRARVTGGREAEVSFRARWLAGSNQLHTRLYFNRLARTTVLRVPARGGGTPGEPNSRLEVNAGPTLRGFGHEPLFPEVGAEVTVSVIAEDPDGVKGCAVWWSVNSREWSSAPMTAAGGGVYRGTIPGQDAPSALVQFYVEAEDTRGATQTFPAGGPSSGAIFKPADGAARNGIAHNLRILVTPEVSAELHRDTNRMSNARVPATVIYRESEVYYDVGVRLRGSERGRPDETRTGFVIGFDPDRPFRGVHRSVSIDPSGGWSSRVPFGSQDEILVKHIVQHAGGIPGMYDDLVYVIAPRTPQTGYALLLMARFGREFLDSQYENGSDGTEYTYELIYSPNTTTNGNPESLKRPLPDSVVGTDHVDLGDDKEQYRWIYLIENNIRRDDYSTIMRFAKTLGLTGEALDRASEEVMDVDQWLRAFAMYSLTGIGDTYMSGNFHNNIYYVRPEDNRVLVFPYDMDFAFVNSPSSALWGPHNLRKVIEIPRNTRRFYVHLQDIIATTFNREYMQHWTAHYGEAAGTNFAGFLTDIEARGRYVLTRIPREVPFAISTSDGQDFTVDATEVELRGTAWINVSTILLAGVEAQPPLAWLPPNTNPVVWEMTVPLEPGPNELTFLAIDAGGEIIAEAGITVTRMADQPPPAMFIRGDTNLDGRINITDATGILFHLFQGAPAPCEDALDVNDDEDLDIVDAVQLLGFLFGEGEPPAPPYPLPGVDPGEAGALGCETGLAPE